MTAKTGFNDNPTRAFWWAEISGQSDKTLAAAAGFKTEEDAIGWAIETLDLLEQKKGVVR